jgi:hypothetical protein
VGRGALTRCAAGLLLASSTAGTAFAFAQAPPEWNAKCGDVDCRVERVSKKWRLLDVKRARSALKLGYVSGGCYRGDGRATVTETVSTIEIALDEGLVVAMDTADGKFACTSELRSRQVVARLDGPIHGRRVLGGSPLERYIGPSRSTSDPDGRIIALAPRVLGLAAQDARMLLTRQHIEATGALRGRVVAQSPAPGKRVGRDGVRIDVSR